MFAEDATQPFSLPPQQGLPKLCESDSLKEIEDILHQALHTVNFIGEMPLEEVDFKYMAQRMRIETPRMKRTRIPDVRYVPPAVFVTSMVFCARYTKENARNFWQPYARVVWGLPEATQNFQSRCRAYFQAFREDLARTYGFYFPIRSSGDVVLPIYRHALLPYYLQDEYAAWLKDHLQDLVEIPAEELAAWLRHSNSLRYMPPTLRRFMQESETAETAAALTHDMAQAAVMYLEEGVSLDDVNTLLVSPIEKDLWRQIIDVLVEQSNKHELRKRERLHPKWVWSLETGEMVLRLTNITTMPAQKPAQCVWYTDGKMQTKEEIAPWHGDDGSWWIDEIVLEDVESHGEIIIQDARGHPILKTPVPSPPHASFLLFRLTQQMLYGIPVDPQHHTLNDGEWLVSMTADCELLSSEGEKLSPEDRFSPPTLLQQQGHRQAGLYYVEFPVTVHIGREEIKLEVKDTNVGQMRIEGDSPPITTSSLVPPAFPDTQVTLYISRLSDNLGRLRVYLKAGEGKAVHYPLDYLKRVHQLRQTQDGHALDLASILPSKNEPAAYRLNILRGVQPVNSSPLEFSVLPGIQIEPPEQDKLYGLGIYPQTVIQGVPLTDVIVPPGAERTPTAEGVQVEWRSLRHSNVCRLQLRIAEQSIPLAWDIRRLTAWLEGVDTDQPLSLSQLENATLHIRGERKQRVLFRIVESSGPPRQIQLDAKGRYDNPLRRDPLLDMIREQRFTRLTVEIIAEGQRRSLVEVVRQATLRKIEAIYLPNDAHIVLQIQPEERWQGLLEVQLRNVECPQAPPIKLGRVQWDGVKELEFRYELPPGVYLPQIVNHRQPMPVTEAIDLIGVPPGSVEGYGPGIHVARALSHLPDKDLSDLSPQTIPTYIYLLANYFAHDTEAFLTPKMLAFLASLPVDTLKEIYPEAHRYLWSLLEQFTTVHQQQAEDHFQQIVEHDQQRALPYWPAWVVLGTPLRFQTPQMKLRAYPEVITTGALAGIGYADITNEGETRERVRVKWYPEDGVTRLEVTAPPSRQSSHFDQLDDLDLWPVYRAAISAAG